VSREAHQTGALACISLRCSIPRHNAC